MNQNVEVQNTGKSLPEIDKVILTIMRVMMADYGKQYKNVCTDQQSALAFKNRLLNKLNEFNISDIYDGYENATEDSPKFMPSIPDIFAHVKILDAKRNKKYTQEIELQRVSALPAPTHSVNAVKLLHDSKLNDKPTDEESRLERLAAARQHHKEVLKIHGRNITKKFSDNSHACAFSGCFKAGSISSIAGYVCAEHYQIS